MKLVDALFRIGILPIELPALDRRGVVLVGLLATIVGGLFALGFLAGAHYCERRVTALEQAGPTLDGVQTSAERALDACLDVDSELHAEIEGGGAAEVWRIEP